MGKKVTGSFTWITEDSARELFSSGAGHKISAQNPATSGSSSQVHFCERPRSFYLWEPAPCSICLHPKVRMSTKMKQFAPIQEHNGTQDRVTEDQE